MRIVQPILAVAASLLLLALLSGCGRYQLGRHAEPPFRSIYVRPVSNETFAPQVQAILSQQLREQFLRDGLLQVESESEADAVLEVVLRTFNRRIAATRPEDTTVAEKLRLELTAFCTLTDSRTGQVYFENRPVLATAQSFPQDRPQQEEFQAMPVLAGDMARRITYEVLQVW
jgi:uncharacterized protein (DUF2267 family)